jgi:predicted small metal-binding protein
MPVVTRNWVIWSSIAQRWFYCHPSIVDMHYGLHALPPWTILRAAVINWRGAMARKYIDCREFPNDANCTLAISGTEQEVLDAAVMHAVSVHGHENAPELRETLRGMLKDMPETRAPAAA